MNYQEKQLLQSMSYFNWHPFIPEAFYEQKGYNVLHSITKNLPYEENQDALKFVNQYLCKAKRLESDADVLRFASDSVTVSGAFLEMGVRIGKTINFIAALNSKETIYGFDSFAGFPEDWDIGHEYVPVMSKDLLALENTPAFVDGKFLPPIAKNVILFKGYFHEILPKFKDQILKNSPIAFLHIDCDIYSSTKDVFDALGSNIVKGTIIAFDELYNYPNYKEHEWKALQEFQKKSGFNIEFIAFNIYHRQVVVKII